MDPLTQGLALSLTGLAVTFASLGLFILIISLLQRFFGAETTSTVQPDRESGEGRGGAFGREDEEIAAAIAVALEYWRSQQSARSDLGDVLVAGRGPWWYSDNLTVPPPIRRGRHASADE